MKVIDMAEGKLPSGLSMDEITLKAPSSTDLEKFVNETVSVVAGYNSYACGEGTVTSGLYSFAEGRPAMAGEFLYSRQFNGITLNYKSVLTRFDKNYYVSQDYKNRVFKAEINVYDDLVQLRISNYGHKELLYKSLREFCLYWNILDRRVLIEKNGCSI